jgi:thermitase
MLLQLGFYVALIALGLWYRYREGQAGQSFGLITLLALAAYAIGMYLSPAALDVKIGFAVRDMVILGVAGLIFGIGVGIGQRAPFWLLLLAALLGLAYYLRDEIPRPKPPQQEAVSAVAEPIALDRDGELLVELKNGAPLAELQAWCAARGATVQQAFTPADGDATELDDYYLVNISDETDWEVFAAELEETSLLDYLEPNEVINVAPLPDENPPAMDRRFRINDPGVEQQWAMEVLDMGRFYQELTKHQPQRKATIAILDTGVDAAHEDLKGNFRSLDDQFDTDPQGHGTHCAGIAGAVTNNGIGVASLALTNDFVHITSVKVLNASGMGTQKSIIDGILYAADAKVDVISMSLGGPSTQSRQRAYNQAVAYANKKGVIVVAAAGNSNRKAKNYSPANAKGIVTVSAIGQDLLRAPFSNRCEEIDMALAAPGVGVYSTKPNNNYRAHSGTSMACPFVAGLAGILRSIDPDMDTQEFYRLVNETGKEIPDGNRTGRLIQPAAALAALR